MGKVLIDAEDLKAILNVANTFVDGMGDDGEFTEQRTVEACERATKLLTEKLEIWVLRIDHRYGYDTSIHSTEQAAKDSLVEYVHQEWESEMGDKDKPSDPAQMIEVYFDHTDDETADISEHELNGG